MGDRVVIVEDDMTLREELRCFLQENDCEVFESNDYHSLLDVLTLQALDVVVLDVNLPGMSGFDITTQLRARLPNVGVIMLTARGGLQDRVRAYDQGADLFFCKPVDPLELLAAIRRVAQRARTSAGWVDTTVYQLDVARMQLSHDSGTCASLQSVEVALIRSLALADQQQLNVGDLINLLEDRFAERTPTRRALENTISRLRGKLKNHFSQDAEPIKALRGFGYQLTWPVKVID